MFTLIRFVFSLVLLAALFWFATSVSLGKRTLWGHMQAIFSTQEAKDLADGTKEEAEKVAKRLQDELHHDAAPTRAAPLDPVGERDRRRLDQLVREKSRAR